MLDPIYSFKNTLNSSLLKAGSLSETKTFGSLKPEKVVCFYFLIVVTVVALVVICTSIIITNLNDFQQ